MNDLRNPTFWMTMKYGCKKECVLIPVLLEYGCEGPRTGTDHFLTPIGTKVVPVPFISGICPRCGDHMMHTRWNEDEALWPMYEGVPEGYAHFRYPTNKDFKKYKERACGKPVGFPQQKVKS